jgi:hypothetical protein
MLATGQFWPNRSERLVQKNFQKMFPKQFREILTRWSGSGHPNPSDIGTFHLWPGKGLSPRGYFVRLSRFAGSSRTPPPQRTSRLRRRTAQPPQHSSRIAADQVFDFIDAARSGFPHLTNRFGSGDATPARFPRSSRSERRCRPGDPPPRRLSSVRSHRLQSRRYPRRRIRSPGSL